MLPIVVSDIHIGNKNIFLALRLITRVESRYTKDFSSSIPYLNHDSPDYRIILMKEMLADYCIGVKQHSRRNIPTLGQLVFRKPVGNRDACDKT